MKQKPANISLCDALDNIDLVLVHRQAPVVRAMALYLRTIDPIILPIEKLRSHPLLNERIFNKEVFLDILSFTGVGFTTADVDQPHPSLQLITAYTDFVRDANTTQKLVDMCINKVATRPLPLGINMLNMVNNGELIVDIIKNGWIYRDESRYDDEYKSSVYQWNRLNDIRVYKNQKRVCSGFIDLAFADVYGFVCSYLNTYVNQLSNIYEQDVSSQLEAEYTFIRTEVEHIIK